jgi:hypothetical protein
MEVNLVGVALPDLDESVPDRAARPVENPSCQMGDLAHGRGDVVIDLDQVVVRIKRQLVG